MKVVSGKGMVCDFWKFPFSSPTVFPALQFPDNEKKNAPPVPPEIIRSQMRLAISEATETTFIPQAILDLLDG